MTTNVDLAPRPGGAPLAQRVLSQARIEARLLITNGEQLLLTMIIPVAALIGVTATGLAEIDEATPGVMALAILATAFTATAIATGFERRSGVLKFLGVTPLGRDGLLAGKVMATAAVLAVQMVVIVGAAVLLGWRPTFADPLVLPAAFVLGGAALGSLGFALAGLLRAEATLAVANAIFLLLLFAGGTVLPADRMPGGVEMAAGALPSAALGDALRHGFGVAGSGSGSVTVDLLVLAIWTCIGVTVSVRSFRWE